MSTCKHPKTTTRVIKNENGSGLIYQECDSCHGKIHLERKVVLDVIPILSAWYDIILEYNAYDHQEGDILVLKNGQKVTRE